MRRVEFRGVFNLHTHFLYKQLSCFQPELLAIFLGISRHIRFSKNILECSKFKAVLEKGRVEGRDWNYSLLGPLAIDLYILPICFQYHVKHFLLNSLFQPFLSLAYLLQRTLQLVSPYFRYHHYSNLHSTG